MAGVCFCDGWKYLLLMPTIAFVDFDGGCWAWQWKLQLSEGHWEGDMSVARPWDQKEKLHASDRGRDMDKYEDGNQDWGHWSEVFAIPSQLFAICFSLGQLWFALLFPLKFSRPQRRTQMSRGYGLWRRYHWSITRATSSLLYEDTKTCHLIVLD